MENKELQQAKLCICEKAGDYVINIEKDLTYYFDNDLEQEDQLEIVVDGTSVY